MKSIELKVARRIGLGKKDAKVLRRNQQVPCVMYGGKEVLHFSAQENAFKDLVYTHHMYLVNLDIDGKTYRAIMKEIQFHPVSDKILHIDFVEVATDRPVVVSLPVEITGNSVGIISGGKLRQRKRYIKVKGLIADLPDTLVVDISDLDIGQSFMAADLKYDRIEILEAPRDMVVGVISSRVAAKGMEVGTEGAAAPAAEGAKPEAASEAKKA
ncbi:MAG TPA: 50S ribosomal protein L25 [Bacteroidales bacterium]|nr:50S ribosomal protein L25 [Bacteroidales bacterium]